jgi:hypothetical protein
MIGGAPVPEVSMEKKLSSARSRFSTKVSIIRAGVVGGTGLPADRLVHPAKGAAAF